MKKTAQTSPVVAPWVKPRSTNGMPPTAPPIWGTRSNTATQAPASGASGTPRMQADGR